MSLKRTTDGVEDDEVLSLQDIINENNELEEMANAVLSGSNDQACTYTDGYVIRQALYACSTCKSNGEAGVCLACSLECHKGHELYELYTKRNFRCDCGNSKFPDLNCLLFEDKKSSNNRNSYNHNFYGTYCTCKRPYPDPEDDVDDEMIQCVVCEDWFHSRHLLGKTPNSDYAEMICHLCMKEKSKYLWYYMWNYNDCDDPVAVCSTADTKGLNTSNCNELEMSSVLAKEPDSSSKTVSSSMSAGNTIHKCLSDLIIKYPSRQFPDEASFWPEQWRECLCPCTDCRDKLSSVQFLYNVADTVSEYERIGASKHNEPTEVSGMKALRAMNRVQQVEVIQGYTEMKDELSSFLRTFAEQGKVVTAQDIQVFFQHMSQRKRPRLDVSYSCK